jgi:hypothetical protein
MLLLVVLPQASARVDVLSSKKKQNQSTKQQQTKTKQQIPPPTHNSTTHIFEEKIKHWFLFLSTPPFSWIPLYVHTPASTSFPPLSPSLRSHSLPVPVFVGKWNLISLPLSLSSTQWAPHLTHSLPTHPHLLPPFQRNGKFVTPSTEQKKNSPEKEKKKEKEEPLQTARDPPLPLPSSIKASLPNFIRNHASA